MTWTYGSAPDTSDRDWIRFRIGDVLSDDPQLSDEEIAALIVLFETNALVALEAAKRLKARYSRLVDTSVGGDESKSFSQRQAHYTDLVAELEAEAGESGGGGGLRVTGTSVSARTSARARTDRVQPASFRSQFSRHDTSDGGSS